MESDHPPLCHPRPQGSAVLSTGNYFGSKHRPSPLSSRPKWRDLQFSQPASDPGGERPPTPLSSRPKWRDLQFSQPASDTGGVQPPTPLSTRPACRGTAVEGSAVLSTGLRSRWRATTHPFAIPPVPACRGTAVERPAVQPSRSPRFVRIATWNFSPDCR
jgi:hypothetical protein